jgi:amidohydrolase
VSYSAASLEALVAGQYEAMVALRRDLHAHPELAFQEHRTARLVAEQLEAIGLEVGTGVGRTGIVALLHGARRGRVLMLRADMDALPIQEQNGAPYASTSAGIMHACGHDGHTATLIAVAHVFRALRAEWAGTIKFVFQPAEEVVGGARAMIGDGVLEDPAPGAVLGLHLANPDPFGRIKVGTGATQASADSFKATITGRGGHGAMPHEAIDPIPVAAEAILALQRIVSREVAPREPVVVSVCSVHAGSADNIIPEEVTFTGTVRTFSTELRDSMPARFERILGGVAAAAGTTHRLAYSFGVPPVVNDAAITELVRAAAADVVGADNVVAAGRAMPSDDMALFLERVPGCYFSVTSGNTAQGLDFAHHHPRFDFDERALAMGAHVLAAAALRYMQQDE